MIKNKNKWIYFDFNYRNRLIHVVIFSGEYKVFLDEVNDYFKKTFSISDEIATPIHMYNMRERYGFCANCTYGNEFYEIIKLENTDLKNPYDIACLAHECYHAAVNIVKTIDPDYIIDTNDEKVATLLQDVFKKSFEKIKDFN